MGFLGFGSKSAGATAELGEDLVGMMKMLAGMPGMARKPMMKMRINQLLSATEEKRQDGIRKMFAAFHSPRVSDSQREKLISTRVEVVGELTEDRRRTLMTSRKAAMKTLPTQEATDIKWQQQVMPQVSAEARSAFERTWREVYGKN
jgi:hypothetical protein